MRIPETKTPVVILHCGLGALAVMRSLGKLGIRVIGVAGDGNSIATRSRYCYQSFYHQLTDIDADGLEQFLLNIADDMGLRPLLIAMTDETAIFVAERYAHLRKAYLIGQNSGMIVSALANKISMFNLAIEHGLPTPKTVLPIDFNDLLDKITGFSFPVMLKGAMGNRLKARTGKSMMVAHNKVELEEFYKVLEDPNEPNVMIQELIPGNDDQVYIFNGYFDKNSDCAVAFTGRKIRQHPIHQGVASMGECCWIEEVAQITKVFMKRIGYTGVLDIGYRKDPRDGKYKVLDINPRVGQAFRIFVDRAGMDVVRALYLDQTGQKINLPIEPREGRRWFIEDCDLVSALCNADEGLLTFGQWLRSFRHVEESAWFDFRDLLPFVVILGRLIAKLVRWNIRSVRQFCHKKLGTASSGATST